eukprot:1253870-Rhodomonas_salina.3
MFVSPASARALICVRHVPSISRSVLVLLSPSLTSTLGGPGRWCTACGHYVQHYKKIAKQLENDDIEVGAVNCEKEKVICGEWFTVGSYPTVMLVGSAERGTQQVRSLDLPRTEQICTSP